MDRRRWVWAIVSAAAGGLLAFAVFQITGQIVLSQLEPPPRGIANLSALLALPPAVVAAAFRFWNCFRAP